MNTLYHFAGGLVVRSFSDVLELQVFTQFEKEVDSNWEPRSVVTDFGAPHRAIKFRGRVGIAISV